MPSDDFTGTVGTHLQDHRADWSAAIGSIDNLTLNDSGQLRGTAEELAAFYSTSTSDISQVVIKANTDTALDTFCGVLVRASASHWYNIHLEGVSAGDYTVVKTQRDGGTTFAVTNAITGYSRGSDHTLRVSVATVGNTVEISSWVDGNFIATRVDVDAERIASGSPGILAGRFSGADTNGNLDDWTDGVSAQSFSQARLRSGS